MPEHAWVTADVNFRVKWLHRNRKHSTVRVMLKYGVTEPIRAFYVSLKDPKTRETE